MATVATSRSKFGLCMPSQPICTDCSDPDVAWASLNRGVFLCTECCSIHRSLGRHISQVRSLRNKAAWHPIQLALVQTLYSHGANNVWEHLLLDPSSGSKIRKKPSFRDPLYPNKAEFIRAKYANLAFALKPNRDGEDLSGGTASSVSSADLNKQLHSCVRTNYVETTLRLLALGADPNGYFDPDTGLTALHVSAKEGQDLQAELICLYGADPAQPDFNGQTAVDHAELAGFKDLALRLIELQYEMTDRLSFFLCHRKPDHASEQHFLIPEISVGQPEPSRLVRRQLQALSDAAFEKLVQDVYDEVDRRDTDAAWSVCLSEDAFMISDRYVVPFLPVNPDLPATRNQHRQKLAKFTGREFSALIIDLLVEAKRRLSTKSDSFSANTLPKSVSTNSSNAREPHKSVESGTSSGGEPILSGEDIKKYIDNDGPVYDSVASDEEDMMALMRQGVEPADRGPSTTPKNIPKPATVANVECKLSRSAESATAVTLEEYLDLKAQLAAAEAMVEEMQKKSDGLETQKRSSMDGCMSRYQKPAIYPSDPRFVYSANKRASHSSSATPGNVCDKSFIHSGVVNSRSFNNETLLLMSSSNSEAASGVPPPSRLFSTRSASLSVIDQQNNSTEGTPKIGPVDKVDQSENYGSAFNSVVVRNAQKKSYPHDSPSLSALKRHSSADQSSLVILRQDSNDKENVSEPLSSRNLATEKKSTFPDNLVLKTEALTAQIQRLFADAQAGRHVAFGAHATRLRAIVDDMVGAVPSDQKTGTVGRTLNKMVDACIGLTVCCPKTPWEGNVEQLSCKVVQAAYEVAKCAKMLMQLIQQ